jgi:hypothetical protein
VEGRKGDVIKDYEATSSEIKVKGMKRVEKLNMKK